MGQGAMRQGQAAAQSTGEIPNDNIVFHLLYITTRASTPPTVTLRRRRYPTKVADRFGIQAPKSEAWQA